MWLLLMGGVLLIGLGAALADQKHNNGLVVPMDRWSEQEVGAWLRSLGPAFEGYADSFVKNGINGPALKSITPHLLEELGVKSHLHQHRITTELARCP